MQHISIIQDSFGQYYRVCTADDGPTRTPLTPEHFRDVVLTEQFVQRLKVPAGYWQRILSRCNTGGINATISVEERISQLLIQGTLTLYRVKHLEKRTGTTLTPTSFPTIRAAKGQDYQLMPASVLLERPTLKVKTFANPKAAAAFIGDLKLDDKQLALLATAVALPGAPTDLSIPTLAQALVDNHFLMVIKSPRRTPQLGKSSEYIPAEASAHKSVTLGPHEEPGYEPSPHAGLHNQAELSNTAPAKYTNIKSMDSTFEREDESDYDHPIWGQETVQYLDDSELKEYELTVMNGKIVHAGGQNIGEVFDTSDAYSYASGEGSAIFIMTPEGKIYASYYQEPGVFHHSSLAQGKPVVSAGEIIVENGALKEISNKSGHYGPSQLMNDQLMDELKGLGLSNYKLSSVLRTGYGI